MIFYLDSPELGCEFPDCAGETDDSDASDNNNTPTPSTNSNVVCPQDVMPCQGDRLLVVIQIIIVNFSIIQKYVMIPIMSVQMDHLLVVIQIIIANFLIA